MTKPAGRPGIHVALTPDVEIAGVREAARRLTGVELNPPWTKGRAVTPNLPRDDLFCSTFSVDQHDRVDLQQAVVLGDDSRDRVPNAG